MPPEIVETLRASSEEVVKIMFTNLLTKTGNLTMASEADKLASAATSKKQNRKAKWGAALVAEKSKAKVRLRLKTTIICAKRSLLIYF